ncbi:MAG: hypothetical protein ABI862_17395 [Ilumatobacteraceae bacterium]
MSTATQIEQLRASAQHLRSVSSLIGSSRALAVHTLAGRETWVGPTADACCAALLSLRGQLQSNQQTLIESARRLERRADVLEQSRPVIGSVS